MRATIIFLLLSAASFGASIYVDAANEGGTEDGSEANPYGTIAEAWADVSGAGDIIFIEAKADNAAYDEQINFDKAYAVEVRNWDKSGDGDLAYLNCTTDYTIEGTGTGTLTLTEIKIARGAHYAINMTGASTINAVRCNFFAAGNYIMIRCSNNGTAYNFTDCDYDLKSKLFNATAAGWSSITIDGGTVDFDTNENIFIYSEYAGPLGSISVSNLTYNGVAGTTASALVSLSNYTALGNVSIIDNTLTNVAYAAAVEYHSPAVYFARNRVTINATAAYSAFTVGKEVTGATGYTITSAANSIVTKTGAFKGSTWATINDKFVITAAGDHGVVGIYNIASVDSADQITLTANATDGTTATTAWCTLDRLLSPPLGAIIEDNTITYASGSDVSHGIAAFADGTIVRGNTIVGSDYGIVAKRNSIEVINNDVRDCTAINIYFAGSSQSLCCNNYSSNSVNGKCFALNTHQSTATALNNVITNNIFVIPSGTGHCLSIPTDQWNAFCDLNIYYAAGTIAEYLSGADRFTASSLAECQAAWAAIETTNGDGYDAYAATNDQNSIIYNPGGQTMVIRLVDGERVVFGLENTKPSGKRTFTAGTGTIMLGE